MIKKIILTFLIIFLNIIPVQADIITPNSLIKVGLSDGKFSKFYYEDNSFYATKPLSIIDISKNTVLKRISENTVVKFVMIDNSFNIYQNDELIAEKLSSPLELITDKDGFIGVVDVKRKGKQALYRGKIQLLKSDTKDNQFATINILELETYLRGVVPNEMPVRFGLEALKAQAVAARNYALRPQTKKYHEFDVCDSTACQVYFGANTEDAIADLAIEQTKNLVALHNENIIVALYSSTAGGYTEDIENAFLTKCAGQAYLKGVPDNENIPKLDNEDDAKEFYTKTPKTYDNASPYFRWTREWTKDELQEILKKTIAEQTKSKFIKPEIFEEENFGELKEIKVKKRGVSGKIIEVEVITDKNNYSISKELVIRRIFKKNGKTLPSANVVFENIFDEEKNLVGIKAFGGGYGHGVGMSQFGAGAMAKEGKSFVQILQHYYHNISLATPTINMTPQVNSVLFEIYLNKKQANLVIKNKIGTELLIIINGKQFHLKSNSTLAGKQVIDISQYVNLGENKVYVFYPLSSNSKKEVPIYLELYGEAND